LNELTILTVSILIAVVLIPYTAIDIILISGLTLVYAQTFLRERVLLLFLLLRPAMDVFRDIHVISAGSIDINLNSAISILFLIWGIMTLWTKREYLDDVPNKYPFIILISLMVMSLFYTISTADTLTSTIRFINLFLIFAISYISVAKEELTLREIVHTILLSSIIPILAGFWQLLAGSGISTFDTHGRLFGTLGHPNVYAFFLLSIIIIHSQFSGVKPTAYWRDEKHHSYRDIIYIVLILLLLLTYTRVTVLGLFLYLSILGIYRYRNLLYTIIIIAISSYVVLFPLNNFLSSTTGLSLTNIPLVSRITDRNEDADSINWRLSVAEETIPIIRSKPFFGYGYGTFESVRINNRSLVHELDDSAEAHNEYLRFALELGIIGFIAFIYLMSSLIVTTLRAGKSTKKLENLVHIVGWMSVIALASLSDNLLRHTPVMWLTFSYWGATIAQAKQKGWGVNFLR
jgi:putative inorganic carbon (hco3(-)) transporter